MTAEMRASVQRRRRRLLVALAITIGLIAGFLFWGRPGSADSASSPNEPAPSTVPVHLEPYRVTVAGPGILEAARTVKITAPAGLSGRLASVARVGDRVDEGAELARLDPETFERALKEAEFALERAQSSLATLEANQADGQASAQQNLREAQARVDLAQREVERTTGQLELTNRLLELGTESPEAVQTAQDASDDAATELADARAALADLRSSQELQENVRAQERRDAQLSVSEAQLDLEEAQENLRALSVTAPFAGVVSAVEVSEGAGVSDGAVLLTLIDDSVLDLPVQVDETEIGKVTAGQEAQVVLDAKPEATLPGTVTAISPVARLESNIPIFDVTVTIENPDLSIRPGMTAEAQITVESFEETASLPNVAVREGDGPYVLIAGENGEETRVPVDIVDSVGFQTVVQGDFQPGAQVLVPAGGPGFGIPGGRPGAPGGGGVVPPR